MKRNELLVLLLVMAMAIGFRFAKLDSVPPGLHLDEATNGTAAIQAWETGDFKFEGLFINLQAVSIHFFGTTAYALRVVSALIGVLTVLGTYALTRRLFDDWRLAAIAAFLMATGFWHVNFSRIGLSAIMAPLAAVWGFYYLYKGIETHRLWHWAVAGLFFGLGFHTYAAFRVMPLAIIVTLVAYWWALRAVFAHGKYAFARHQMLGGVACMLGIMVLVALPIAADFSENPGSMVVSIHGPTLAHNAARTLGMFLVRGDDNWLHNIPGEPILYWPVAALFALGLVHSIWRLLHSIRTQGHPSVAHSLVLGWFAVGLLPGIFSNKGIPNAMLVLTVAPAVYIIAGLGLHWLYTWMLKWYTLRDKHEGEGALLVTIAVVALLTAFAVADGSRYFVRWARHPEVSRAFSAQDLPIADRLNALPPGTLKYIIVTRDAHTVMYLTDTGTPEKQQANHLTYLTPEQFRLARIPRGAVVISLSP